MISLPPPQPALALAKSARKELILQRIRAHNWVSFGDLSAWLRVSEDTVRRDLNEMADQQLVTRVRGGAMATTHLPALGSPYAQAEKQAIARKAVALIEDGMLVLISGGTTVREVARLLPDPLRATFVVLNPLTAVELSAKPNLSVILVGGQLSKHNQLVVGGEVITQLAGMRADLCLTGNNALHPTAGFTDLDWETVQVKQRMIRSADRTAVLTIAEKLDTTMRFKIAALSELHYLLTDLDPADPRLDAYRRLDIR